MAILTQIEADKYNFLDQTITGDEKWVYQHDLETKQQSKQWLPHGLSGTMKFKSEMSFNKVMANVFWDSKGIVLVDFLEGWKTVTEAYYTEVLRNLRAEFAKKWPGKLHRGIFFRYDNAPAHSLHILKNVLR